MSDADIRSEVEALERQGHRRLLVLTGEHPKYTFDQFLHVSFYIPAGCWEVLHSCCRELWFYNTPVFFWPCRVMVRGAENPELFMYVLHGTRAGG